MWINFAKKEDIQNIIDMEKECFENKAWNKEMIESDFEKRSSYLICYTNEDEPIGYLGFLDLDSECEILRIGIRKRFRKQGYAQSLIEYLFDFCLEQKKDKIFLEVSSLNNVAINLYRKMGFKLINVRKNYYSEGNDALNYVKLL